VVQELVETERQERLPPEMELLILVRVGVAPDKQHLERL